jgi:hypothetical protein
VQVHTSLSLSGSVAQYGRGVGIIQATAAQLIAQFATCLESMLAQETAPAARTAAATPPKPIAGLALLARAIWNWIAGLLRRP